jgi:hypothetical protein
MMQKLVVMLGLMAALAMPAMGDTITYPFWVGQTDGDPANVPAETVRLEGLISGWNGSFKTPTLPALSGGSELTAWNWIGEQFPVDNGGNDVTLNLLGFDGYLMLKWGNTDSFYRINDGLAEIGGFNYGQYSGDGEYTFYSDVYPVRFGGTDTGHPGLGLSHYTLWGTGEEGGGGGDGNPSDVPDTGVTMALMAFGLVSLAGVKKYAFA